MSCHEGERGAKYFVHLLLYSQILQTRIQFSYAVYITYTRIFVIVISILILWLRFWKLLLVIVSDMIASFLPHLT